MLKKKKEGCCFDFSCPTLNALKSVLDLTRGCDDATREQVDGKHNWESFYYLPLASDASSTFLCHRLYSQLSILIRLGFFFNNKPDGNRQVSLCIFRVVSLPSSRRSEGSAC